MEGCQQSWSDPRQLPRVITHIVAAPCRGIVSDTIHDMCVRQGRALGIPVCLDLEESDSEEDTEFAVTVKKTGLEQKTLRVNKAAANFFIANSLPPTLFDKPTWKALVSALDPAVKTYSSTKFVDVCIPACAIEVNMMSKKLLKKEEHLTASCDGCTIRSVQSIYTVHATRRGPDRESYLLIGDEASGHSHTSEHIRDVILKVRVCTYVHNTPYSLTS